MPTCPTDVNAMAARTRPLEQVRAGFRVLVRQVDQALKEPDAQKRGDTTRGAFNGFATFTGPFLFFLMQADRRGVEAGREAARSVSTTMTRAAVILVVLAAIVSLAFYRLISRPTLAAVAEIRDAAIAIGQGERNLRLPVRHRDELGLLAVVFNRMTARLRRGEQRVVQRPPRAGDDGRRPHRRPARGQRQALGDRREPAPLLRRRQPRAAHAADRDPRRMRHRAGRSPIRGAGAGGRRPPPERRRPGSRWRGLRRHPSPGRRLQRRVEDMLRVARSESGTIELHFQRVSLQAVCAGAVDAFEGATKRRDVAILVEDRCRRRRGRRRRRRMAAPDRRGDDRQRPALRHGSDADRAPRRPARRGRAAGRARRRSGLGRRRPAGAAASASPAAARRTGAAARSRRCRATASASPW